MPVYHITIHAYGSYLPDHDAGSFHWQRGFQEPNDDHLADEYRRRQNEPTASFTDQVQGPVLDEVRTAAKHQTLRVMGIAFEPTHFHVVVAWDDENRDPIRVRASLKSSITRRLNRDVARRSWLSGRGVPKRVWDRGHLRYLLTEYLPKHSGRQWYEHRSREAGPEPRCGPA